MKKANIDIREEAQLKNVFLYQIADKMGIQETRFCKMLRKELVPEQKERIKAIIDTIAREEAV